MADFLLCRRKFICAILRILGLTQGLDCAVDVQHIVVIRIRIRIRIRIGVKVQQPHGNSSSDAHRGA